MRLRVSLVSLLVSVCLLADDPSAWELYENGRAAEKAGHMAQAYLLYAEAAAMEPRNKTYWQRAQAVQSRAALEARPQPTIPTVAELGGELSDEPEFHFEKPSAEDLAAAVAACGDVDLVINNAGVIGSDGLLNSTGVESLRAILETNLYGVLAVSRAFAPVLAANGGGALVNMLSALSWASLPTSGAYSVSKAAAWSLTNGLRNELREQGTLVVGVHAGYIDTDMVKDVDSPKSRPEDIAQAVLTGIEAGDQEVLADDTSRQVKAGLTQQQPMYLGARPA